MALLPQQESVLAAFADSIINAAHVAGKEPVEFAQAYGAGGATLVIARGLEAKAAELRKNAQTAVQQAEDAAQKLEAQSRAVQQGLVTQTTTTQAA